MLNVHYLQIALGLIVLLAQVGLGLRMRKYGSGKGRLKTAAAASALGMLIALGAIVSENWQASALILVAVVGGPWLALLVASLPSLKRLRKTASHRYKFAQDAFVVIECGQAYGNGFFIAEELIVTALHILTADFGGRLWAHTTRGRVELELAQVLPATDLLLLKLKSSSSAATSHGVLKLASGSIDITIGDTLVATGYRDPHKMRPQWQEAQGKLLFRGPSSAYGTEAGSAVASTDRSLLILVAEIRLARGDSGSPVLNDKDEVVGVVSAGHELEGILIPVESVQELFRLHSPE